MLSTFQIRFVVLIVALNHVAGNSLIYSPGSKIQCKWNCSVHTADLTALKREMANSTTTNNKLIKLNVQYEKLIDDKCSNEKSFDSSEVAFEHCQVCLVNKRLFSSMKSNKSSTNSFIHKEHREIRANCTLKPAKTTLLSPMDYSNCSSAICHLINFEDGFESIDCHVVGTDPFKQCMNFTIPDRTNSTKGLQGAVDLRGWSIMALSFLYSVFNSVFVSYSLAFLCLFHPTEILHNGVTHIVLEGESPVSLRGFVGNCFFSRKGGIWHKAKTFILRVFIIPLPFLISATVLADFERDVLDKRLFIVFGFCYCIQASYISFNSKRSMKANPCFFCKFFKPTILCCSDELPQEITNHLRIQPLILVECWRHYKRYLLYYFQMFATLIPSCRCSIVFMLRFMLLIFLLICTPVVAVMLLIVVSLLIIVSILFTAPIAVFCMAQYRPSAVNSKILISSFRLILVVVSFVSWFGAFQLLLSAAFGARNAFQFSLELIYSEEHLSYVVCFGSVLYYIWSFYSLFTETYHQLALALYDCYKDSKRTQFQDVISTSNQLSKLPNNAHDLDNVIAIPKELFEMACEELLPLRESVCLLIMKIIALVVFMFIMFFWVIAFNFTMSLIKTAFTIFTSALPKIVSIFTCEDWNKKLGEKIMQEKVKKIVDEFIDETSRTTRAQRDINANNDEVFFEDKDDIELEIMSSTDTSKRLEKQGNLVLSTDLTT